MRIIPLIIIEALLFFIFLTGDNNIFVIIGIIGFPVFDFFDSLKDYLYLNLIIQTDYREKGINHNMHSLYKDWKTARKRVLFSIIFFVCAIILFFIIKSQKVSIAFYIKSARMNG